MLENLKAAAESVGITVVIATSDKNINDQLNRITRIEKLPLALITWDLDVTLEFDESGHLKNPTTDVTMLLVNKAETLEKIDLENMAEKMGELFIKFLRVYKDYLAANTNVKENPITGATFTYVPSFGSAKHSGVLGKFNTQMNLEPLCQI